MNKYSAYALRFFFLLFLQVFLFQNVPLGQINVYIYPAFCLFLPTGIFSALIIFLSFCMGALVDLFYDTDGLHTASSVFSAFLRLGLLLVLEPRGGYDMGQVPNRQSMSLSWYLRYSALFIGSHMLFLTLIEELSLSLFWFLQFLIEFSLAYIIISIYQFLFNPR